MECVGREWENRIINLRDRVAELPTDPGVYLYKDGHGTVIYVGKAGRLPTIVATNAITIATAHGKRCNRHSSQGASPPQYCDSSAAPSTTALAPRTNEVKARVGCLMFQR